MRWSWLVFVLVAAACADTDSGPEAPAPQPAETVCSAAACATIPGDWVVEVGDGFVSFTHPADSVRVLSTVGDVDMERVVAAAGGTWPTTGSWHRHADLILDGVDVGPG